MARLNFKILKAAWNHFKKTREDDIKAIVPDLTDIDAVHLKRLQEDDGKLLVQFSGFRSAVQDQNSIPQAKRAILTWLKNFSMGVQMGRSDQDTMIVSISKDLQHFGEAAISIFKRDPKSNKKKTYYKCIGGKKDGRRVSNPNDCIGVPDPSKKIKFAISKRAKYGQASKAKKKTQLTNITARRIRKANQRLKKARGF